MKVQVLASNDSTQLQKWINDFIKDRMIIDIKYNSVSVGNSVNDRVLILYEDFEDVDPLNKEPITAEDIVNEREAAKYE